MQNDPYPSRLLNDAVDQLSRLPGVGRRTALRLALYLLRLKKEEAVKFTDAIRHFIEEIKFCRICHNLSDEEVCPICSSTHRDSSTLCVVENVKDVMSIENTHQFRGLYHVLGGLISPMEGFGPKDLQIDSLEKRIANGGIREVILALSATLEGDTTNFYIYRKLKNSGAIITVIARGVSFGDELEYTDELTLGKSIMNRVPFEDDRKGS